MAQLTFEVDDDDTAVRRVGGHEASRGARADAAQPCVRGRGLAHEASPVDQDEVIG